MKKQLTDEEIEKLKAQGFQKGHMTSEEAKARGSRGGKRSAEVRREKRDAKQAIQYMLQLSAKGKYRDNLDELGVEINDQTNMVALAARVFTKAMSGDLDAFKELMKIAGYEPEENRKERESINSDRRRDLEIESKVNALGGGVDGAKVALNMSDEDSNTDVVIYLPEIDSEEKCSADDKGEENKK